MSTISTAGKPTQVSSTRVRAGKRSYFFDLNAGPKGGLYLSISETVAEESGFRRNRIMVFDSNVRDFYEGLCEAIRAMREEQKKREPAAEVESSAKSRKKAA